MRLAVLQSNYIPWKGYFDLMAMADAFVVYDSVQYTKNDWRNRNKIMSNQGPVWLTIPVSTSGRADQRINEAVISDPRWSKKHWTTITQQFSKRPHFDRWQDDWRDAYLRAAEHRLLHDVNVLFLEMLARQLSITTPMLDDRAFDLEPDTPSGKLVQLCQSMSADRSVTGPAGLGYLETDRFHEHGIAVDVIDYSAYPTYSQPHTDFDHGVSVIDLMASVGEGAETHLLGRCTTVVDDYPA